MPGHGRLLPVRLRTLNVANAVRVFGDLLWGQRWQVNVLHAMPGYGHL